MNESKGELNRFKMCSLFEYQNNNYNINEVDIQNNLQNKKDKSKSFKNLIIEHKEN